MYIANVIYDNSLINSTSQNLRHRNYSCLKCMHFYSVSFNTGTQKGSRGRHGVNCSITMHSYSAGSNTYSASIDRTSCPSVKKLGNSSNQSEWKTGMGAGGRGGEVRQQCWAKESQSPSTNLLLQRLRIVSEQPGRGQHWIVVVADGHRQPVVTAVQRQRRRRAGEAAGDDDDRLLLGLRLGRRRRHH